MRDKTVLHTCDPVGVEQGCEVRVVRQFVQHDSEIDRVVTRGDATRAILPSCPHCRLLSRKHELVDLVLPALATLARLRVGMLVIVLWACVGNGLRPSS